jgi:2,4-dienoyl-CoA reductase-like NADH-dependent reductase (Old Yellow Enzyme family)
MYMSDFPHLFSPINIAGHTYKNRILAAPLVFGISALMKSRAEILYRLTEARARGGAPRCIIGETPVNGPDAPDFLSRNGD